jgi:hypothetical protein
VLLYIHYRLLNSPWKRFDEPCRLARGSVIIIRSHGVEDGALLAKPVDALGPGGGDSAIHQAVAEPGEVVERREGGMRTAIAEM